MVFPTTTRPAKRGTDARRREGQRRATRAQVEAARRQQLEHEDAERAALKQRRTLEDRLRRAAKAASAAAYMAAKPSFATAAGMRHAALAQSRAAQAEREAREKLKSFEEARRRPLRTRRKRGGANMGVHSPRTRLARAAGVYGVAQHASSSGSGKRRRGGGGAGGAAPVATGRGEWATRGARRLSDFQASVHQPPTARRRPGQLSAMLSNARASVETLQGAQHRHAGRGRRPRAQPKVSRPNDLSSRPLPNFGKQHSDLPHYSEVLRGRRRRTVGDNMSPALRRFRRQTLARKAEERARRGSDATDSDDSSASSSDSDGSGGGSDSSSGGDGVAAFGFGHGRGRGRGRRKSRRPAYKVRRTTITRTMRVAADGTVEPLPE